MYVAHVFQSIACVAGVTIASLAMPAALGAPTIELVSPTPGVGLVVVRARDLGTNLAAGYQVFLDFDATRVTFLSGAYVTTGFGQPVVNPIRAVGNQITLAAGINLFAGQTPTNANQDLAYLFFSSTGTACTPRVRIRPGTVPPTRFTDNQAQPINVSTVSLWSGCPSDIDNSGTVTVDDIFAFLALWFARDCRADFDNANGVTVSDIFAFLAAWFSRC